MEKLLAEIQCRSIKEWILVQQKVTTEEMEGIPHYMIDILPPDASFSAYEFKKGRKIY